MGREDARVAPTASLAAAPPLAPPVGWERAMGMEGEERVEEVQGMVEEALEGVGALVEEALEGVGVLVAEAAGGKAAALD